MHKCSTLQGTKGNPNSRGSKHYFNISRCYDKDSIVSVFHNHTIEQGYVKVKFKESNGWTPANKEEVLKTPESLGVFFYMWSQ